MTPNSIDGRTPLLYESVCADDFAGHPQAEEILPLFARCPNLLITGANGVGKTFLAAAISNTKHIPWCSVSWLMIRVRRTFRMASEETEFSLLEPLIDVRGLVLDDLLACQKTEFGISTLLAILSARIESKRITIVTCDKSLAEIDAIDSSLASRLGGFRLLVMKGSDRRVPA